MKYRWLYYLKEGVVCKLDYEHYCDWDEHRLVAYLYKFIFPLVDKFNFNEFYIDSKNERFPLYYLFACGRCSLCRQKKSSEYAFRAACESHVHPEGQLFVTLTYNDNFLPSDGVSKKDLQNFFKRLRWRLSCFGLSTDFRYLAVSEYGAKFGRPHYHIIFWNLPKLSDPLRIHSYIRLAWCQYLLDSDGKRKCVYSKKMNKWYPIRRSMGIVKILPVTTGCTAYITKYFRKEGSNKMNYPNKTFLLSSRKNGGIGSQYIRSQYNFVKDNFDVSAIQVVDYNINKVFQYPISGYVKYLLFPCKSVLYRKNNYYHEFRKFSTKIDELDACIAYYCHATGYRLLNYRWDITSVAKPILRWFHDKKSTRYLTRIYSWFRHYTSDKLLVVINNLIDELKKILKNVDFDTVLKLNSLYLIRERYRKYCLEHRKCFWYDISSSINSYEVAYNKYLTRCIF
ncbi:replication initiator protein [Sigmofec virus UA08Rod_4138]|uniref:Replication initiator protein n=1 Tax=Sigmofec virus UA08Rod_4138 TaxID=2929396 RepID=A0A976N204_9VIRU|nr:replication initiator protein [Sigmofec virus UA08Rod_4138]